jgi:hypothetical protein
MLMVILLVDVHTAADVDVDPVLVVYFVCDDTFTLGMWMVVAKDIFYFMNQVSHVHILR